MFNLFTNIIIVIVGLVLSVLALIIIDNFYGIVNKPKHCRVV